MRRDTVFGTFLVAAVLCVVCSVLVSAAAVGLRPFQSRNVERERQKNILEAAGLYDPDAPVPIREAFQKIETRIVDLDTGRYVPPSEIAPDLYDQQEAAKDPARSKALSPDEDLAGIKRRENASFVYVVKGPDGRPDQYILPVYGKGLWSTMYGFLAVDKDLTTVRGLTFYSHGETPGLGGEIDNPQWKASWQGKVLFDEGRQQVAIDVIKGSVDPSMPEAEHKIDGLSGATITSRGVENLIHFWLGKDGFGPFLQQIQKPGNQDGPS